MDCAVSGSLAICGNFAELLPEKPENFDYMSTAKWLEDYPFEMRERIGGTICSCKKVEVNYAPYYGWSHYHNKNCNLIQKIRKQPGLLNLWAYGHLPSIYS